MTLTVSFPVGVLGGVSQSDFYTQIFTGLTEIVNEADVQGVQIYPAQWPRKVLITVNNVDVKEALLVSGLNIYGQHIELRDEDEQFTRVTVKDLSIDFPDKKLEDLMNEYGKVVRVEKEMIYVNGKKTSWTTGTRFVSLCPLYYTIPQRLSIMHDQKQLSMSVWYKRPPVENQICKKCGGSHRENECPHQKFVCFICKGDHRRKDCPQYDGSRVTDQVFCFMTRKSPLSNFNMNYPITINGKTYSCNEMYIQEQKALLFGDKHKADMIVRADDPKEMKSLGKDLKGYKDSVWKQNAKEITMTCNREKIYSYPQLQEYLLQTGDRQLGEATPDPLFGIGLHIGDPNVENTREWSGKNLMGGILTELRSELLLVKQLANDSIEVFEPITKDEQVNQPVCDPPVKSNDAPLPRQHILMLGDSNLKEVELDVLDAEILVDKICKPGASLEDIPDLLSECSLAQNEVPFVVLHLGTYNWPADYNNQNIESGEAIYREYVEAVNACADKFPHAHFVISGILPRKSLTDDQNSQQNRINVESTKLNKLLYEMGKKESNVTFIDNDDGFYASEDEVVKDLFVDRDSTGIHLNDRGVKILSDNITVAIRQLVSQ